MVSRSIWYKHCKGYFKNFCKAMRDIWGVLKCHEPFGPQQFFTYHGQSFDEWGRLPYPFSQGKKAYYVCYKIDSQVHDLP